MAAWSKLGEDSFQWGRGPLLPGVRRPLVAFFTPVLGYVSARLRISVDALPFRPNRGLHITLTRLPHPHSAETHEQFRWQDRVRLPDLLGCDGVAGAWTFSLLESQRHPTLPIDSAEDRPGALRIRLLYLDDDPAAVAHDIAERTREWDAAGRGAPHPDAEQVLFSGPLKTIIPWQDW